MSLQMQKRDLILSKDGKPWVNQPPPRALKRAFDRTLAIVAAVLRFALSLAARKRIVKWLGRKKWPGQCVFSIETLRDFARQDANGFHRYLWSNHLAYAQNYEIARQFGISHQQATRRIFFSELTDHLRSRGIDPDRDVRSVFEVGCSLGHLLRFAETELFRSATTLRGLDIDRYAVEAGAAHLRQLGSKVELITADVEEADRVMGDESYDVVFCCGVLTYMDEAVTSRVVASMLRHAKVAVAMLSVAHPHVDNAGLLRSDVCPGDEAFVHNLDAMVRSAGGKVTSRRWEGARMFDGHTIYIVVAEPARSSSPLPAPAGADLAGSVRV